MALSPSLILSLPLSFVVIFYTIKSINSLTQKHSIVFGSDIMKDTNTDEIDERNFFSSRCEGEKKQHNSHNNENNVLMKSTLL